MILQQNEFRKCGEAGEVMLVGFAMGSLCSIKLDDILLVALLDVPLPPPQTWDQNQVCYQQAQFLRC